MFQALKFNKPTFVQLLIDNDFDVDTFLTDKHLKLYQIYSNHSDFKEAPFNNYYNNKFNNHSTKFETVKEYLKKFIEEISKIELESIFFTEDSAAKLFIWSILYNRSEIAEIFLLKAKVYFSRLKYFLNLK